MVVMLIAALALLLLTGVALAFDGYDLSWYVIGGGGGHSEAAPYALDGTVGQAVAGPVSSAPYDLCSGYWCGGAVEYNIYLPLIIR
jgi:hypothetical protein